MDPRDLEALVDRNLRALPSPRAPRSLLPRVMTAIAAAPSAAPARGWRTWPAWGKAAAVVVFVLSGGVSAVAAIGIDRAADRLASAAPWLGALSTLSRVVWQGLLQPAAAYVVILFVVSMFVCAAAWSAMSRLTLGASRS